MDAHYLYKLGGEEEMYIAFDSELNSNTREALGLSYVMAVPKDVDTNRVIAPWRLAKQTLDIKLGGAIMEETIQKLFGCSAKELLARGPKENSSESGA